MSTPSREPYTMWSFQWPFDKHGVPVRGNSGRTIRPVVIMEADTFKRMLSEHESLGAAQFRVGTEEES